MIFTYHEEIPPKGTENLISHEALSDELKEFISKHNVEQDRYLFHDNGYYFFIYLNNGDRIDCKIK